VLDFGADGDEFSTLAAAPSSPASSAPTLIFSSPGRSDEFVCRRRDEHSDKNAGENLAKVEAVRRASLEELVELALPRLARMLS
jgi:hypothetical protein